jgi:hypothetical protein
MGIALCHQNKSGAVCRFHPLQGNFYRDGEITGHFTKDINSFGTELTADVNIMRFYAPINIGIRTSYLPEMENVYFDLLFSVDFTSF